MKADGGLVAYGFAPGRVTHDVSIPPRPDERLGDAKQREPAARDDGEVLGEGRG